MAVVPVLLFCAEPIKNARLYHIMATAPEDASNSICWAREREGIIVRSWKATYVARLVGCLGAAVLLLLAVGARADATVLFSNGGVTGGTGRCDSYPDVCNGDGTGWVIYDDFTLGSSATMTGFTYNDLIWREGPDVYVSTNWWLYDGDPISGGTLVYSGGGDVTTITLDSSSGLGDYLFTFGGISGVTLDGGTVYWLGIQNVLSGGYEESRATSAGNGLPGYVQEQPDGNHQYSLSGDTAFTIEGDPIGGTTPEPASLTLLGLGFAGLYLGRRRRA